MKGDQSNGEVQTTDGLQQHPSNHQGWAERPNGPGRICDVEEHNELGDVDDDEGFGEMICEGCHKRKSYQELLDRRLHTSEADLGRVLV